MSQDQILGLKDRDRRDREIERMELERDKEVEAVIVCFDCGCDADATCSDHDTKTMYRCLTCGEDYETYDKAFNCHAQQEIRI